MAEWGGLNPPYRTIVVDPPWSYKRLGPRRAEDDESRVATPGRPWPYTQMSLKEIRALPIGELAAEDCRIFLWATHKHLRWAWSIMEDSWGFTPGRLLTWIKKPRGTNPVTTEFLLFGKRGSPPILPWLNSTWFDWPRPPGHSEKPAAAYDMIEEIAEGPCVDIFSRQTRLGWDSWGLGVESAPEVM